MRRVPKAMRAQRPPFPFGHHASLLGSGLGSPPSSSGAMWFVERHSRLGARAGGWCGPPPSPPTGALSRKWPLHVAFPASLRAEARPAASFARSAGLTEGLPAFLPPETHSLARESLVICLNLSVLESGTESTTLPAENGDLKSRAPGVTVPSASAPVARPRSDQSLLCHCWV